MSTLDSLPGDQRAVLQLVLGKGRGYTEIAGMLSLDPGAVRARAVAAARTLVPPTSAPPGMADLVVDYLLGQLDTDGVERAMALLADSPGERAWARAVAASLAPLARVPLPEIPSEPLAGSPSAPDPGSSSGDMQQPWQSQPPAWAPPEGQAPPPAWAPPEGQAPPPAWAPPEGQAPPPAWAPPDGQAPPPAWAPPPPVSTSWDQAPPAPVPAPAPPPAHYPATGAPAPAPEPSSVPDADERSPGSGRRRRRVREDGGGRHSDGPRTSRIGGAVLIVVAVAVVLILIVRGTSSNPGPAPTPKPAASASSSSTPAPASSQASSSTKSGSTTATKVLAQINLLPPASARSKAAGIAEILREGGADGLAIVAQNVPPNATKPPNAYAVWLYNSPTDARNLGFVNPGVGTSGRFSTATTLPADASRYHQLLVTVETSASPKVPGRVILEGPLSGL